MNESLDVTGLFSSQMYIKKEDDLKTCSGIPRGDCAAGQLILAEQGDVHLEQGT